MYSVLKLIAESVDVVEIGAAGCWENTFDGDGNEPDWL